MTSDLVLTRLQGEVLEIQINRADKLNALNDEIYAELAAQLQSAQENSEIKVVLLSGSGKHFCSGNDLTDFLEVKFGSESNVVLFLNALVSLSKPLVVAVSGAVIGIGTTLLLHSDMVFAARDSQFCLPFLKLGLTPEGGSSQLLAERCGNAKANEWLLSGRKILADEALASGLVNQLCDDRDICWQAADNFAQKLTASSLELLMTTKQMLNKRSTEERLELIDKEVQIFAQRLETDEAQAALQEFFCC